MTRVTVVPDAEAVARAAADGVASRIRSGAVHIALAGGTSPERCHELLAEMDLDWSGVHLWLSDERCVPADHEDANQRMLDESLLSKLRSHEGPHLHPVRGDLSPEDAAWLYARELVQAIGEEPVFDLVLLGMGEDGHTASLFPGHPAALAAHAPVIGIRDSPKPPPERITLTLPVIAAAGYPVLLATGAGKRDALARVRAREPELPITRLGDDLDEIVADEAAAAAAASA